MRTKCSRDREGFIKYRKKSKPLQISTLPTISTSPIILSQIIQIFYDLEQIVAIIQQASTCICISSVEFSTLKSSKFILSFYFDLIILETIIQL